MKKKFLINFTPICIAFMMGGCSDSAIKCDDSDAKATVMQIVEEEFKNQLTQDPRVTYADLKAANTDYAKKAVALYDKQYEEANPQLANIRTENVNKDLQKSECAAEITFTNGNKVDITYKLSKTTEGNLYAEVFGLR